MKKMVSGLFSVAILSATMMVNSASAQLLYAEGKDYTVIENPLPLHIEGENEVVEFFSYACPHCSTLDPLLVKWSEEKMPENTKLYQVPAVGSKVWTFVARAKFTADKLDLGHDFDLKYFDGIHKENNRQLLGSEKAVFDFMVNEGGAELKDVTKAWNSLQVRSNLIKSAEMWKQAKLDAVPAVIVNGTYVVKLRESDEFFAVIEFLIKQYGVKPAEIKFTEIKTPKNETAKVATEPEKTEAVKTVVTATVKTEANVEKKSDDVKVATKTETVKAEITKNVATEVKKVEEEKTEKTTESKESEKSEEKTQEMKAA